MRSFQRADTLDPVPGSIVAALRRIDLAAGGEARHVDQLPQLLDALREQARIESITASSAIEGVIVAEGRAPALATAAPPRFRNRSEAEFAGYSAALDYLNNGTDHGPLSVGLLMHLHRLLFSFTDDDGGRFKLEDNLVIDRHADGTTTVRFQPVAVRDTEFYMAELVERTNAALTAGVHHPLLVIAACSLDLLCIHPFGDGNGRVARLLTTFLLQRCGYGVGRYVSLEQLIYETKDGYYEALRQSTDGWFDDAQHSLWPWAGYFLERLAGAYDRFSARIAASTNSGTKQDRIRDFILLHAPPIFSISDIRRAVPGVSDQTIRLVLAELKESGHVTNDGVGRSATWSRP
ncbi:MAG: cell filamentation protein Fic [Acidimicrobiales bacterium mtb01]|nr:Fic family protein [Actinomycetota bacterium]TEX48245.1 MAG: cell filamentation protein Fic [Acidimicrobiales bacterium mtb01]